MSGVVCDASVLFKLLVPEPDSDRAGALMAQHQLIAPEICYAEVGNAIWSRIKHAGLDPDLGQALLVKMDTLPLDLRAFKPLVSRALSLAATLGHPIYDCFYLALAENVSAPLVTADKRFLSVLGRAGLPNVEAVALADFNPSA